MNSNQMAFFFAAKRRAAEIGHTVDIRRTPVSEIARCKCTWSHTEVFHGNNALARRSKMDRAIYEHLRVSIEIHERKATK